MIEVPTTKWIRLYHAVFSLHRSTLLRTHVIILENVKVILKESYNASYKFASPNNRYAYVLTFDTPQLETLFRLRFSDYI